jgi:H/ACA ribonucleoprotein complex subunit 3
MLKCPQGHGYTLKEKCPVCAASVARAGPAKYSPEDLYGAYRRKLKLLTASEGRAGK